MEAQSEPARKLLWVAVLAISFAAIFFREAGAAHPIVQCIFRLSLASVCLSPWWWPVIRKRSLGSKIWSRCFLGGIAYAFHFGTWVTSLSMTTVAASVTLVTATPLFLAAYGWVVTGDAPSRPVWRGLGLAVIGIVCIGWADGSTGDSSLTGDALALLGAMAMGGYLLVGNAARGDLSSLAFSGLSTGMGAMILLLYAWALEIPIEVSGAQTWAALIGATLIPQLVGHTILTWCSRQLPPVHVGMATLGEPAGAALLAWLWFGEVPGAGVLAGASLTLGGLAVSMRSSAQE